MPFPSPQDIIRAQVPNVHVLWEDHQEKANVMTRNANHPLVWTGAGNFIWCVRSVWKHRTKKDFANSAEPCDGAVVGTRDAQHVAGAFSAIGDFAGWLASHQDVKAHLPLLVFETRQAVAILGVILAYPALTLLLYLHGQEQEPSE